MNPEFKHFKYMLAAGIAGASSLFLAACQRESQPMCIGQYPVRSLSETLRGAREALRYEPPSIVRSSAIYPNGNTARQNIQRVIDRTPDFDVQDRLKQVLKFIPDESEIRAVQGRSVTSAMFKEQIDQLYGVTSYARSIQRPCGVGVKVSQN